MFEYGARLVNVIDGDTIDVMLDLGFEIYKGERLRFRSVDTDEIFSRSTTEGRERGLAAKAFVIGLLTDRPLTVRTFKTASGKERQTLGRYLAEVWFIDDDNKHVEIGQQLIAGGFQKKP